MQDPVLQRLQVHDTIAGRAGEPITEDLTDRTDRGYLRLNVARESWKLPETIEDLLQRFFVGVVECELQLHIRQAVQRNRPDGAKVAQSRGLVLDRDRDVTLDLLGREAGTLRHHVDHGRRWIGIGLDIELVKRNYSATERCEEQHHHQHALLDGKFDDFVHGEVSCVRLIRSRRPRDR